MKLKRIKSVVLLSLLAAGFYSAQAQEKIIQARVALANFDPQYSEAAGNWQNSSVQTSAPGVEAGKGSRFNTTAGSQIILTPELTPGGSYLLQAAFPAPSSQSADIVVSIALEGATLTDFSPTTTLNNGVIESTVFQRAGGNNVWRPIGKLVLNEGVSTPTITFTHLSGTLSSSTARFYSDSYRFVNASDPCLSGLASLSTVNGPLAAGQTFVNVPGVATNATKVTVYADGVQIGQKSTGVLGGTNVEVVVTTALVAGQTITVTQHNSNDVESCRPNTGPIVGSGANPPVRVAFSLRMDPALTGPAGAEGTSSSTWLWMLGGTGPTAGFGTAPLGGPVLQPSTCWQTVTLDYNVDPGYSWAGTTGETPTFAILDSLAFSMEEPFNSGPYAIYVDNIRNGTNIIETFEGQETGANYLLNAPGFSGSTSPFLLSGAPGSITPNVSAISDTNADTGTNSVFLNWQFKDAAAASWVRIPLQGVGRKNPQVDLSQPISVRLLVLPVGQTSATLQVADIGNVAGVLGQNVTLQAATIKGGGTLTYQWRKNGEDITGQTGATLTINNATAEANGNYSVVVSDGTCTTESFGTLTVTDQPVAPALTFSRSGNTLTLTWSDTQAVLQSASTLTGSPTDWSDVPNATSPYEVTTTEAMRFFRLKR